MATKDSSKFQDTLARFVTDLHAAAAALRGCSAARWPSPSYLSGMVQQVEQVERALVDLLAVLRVEPPTAEGLLTCDHHAVRWVLAMVASSAYLLTECDLARAPDPSEVVGSARNLLRALAEAFALELTVGCFGGHHEHAWLAEGALIALTRIGARAPA